MPILGNTLSSSKSSCTRKKMVSTRSSKLEFKFFEGERVLCFEPDVTKARVLYDAKVLEINVKKDGRGRKSVEYLIHFQGWNSSWDRFVKESFILHDTPENRTLQKELAVTARTLLKEKQKKRQKLGSALKGAEPKFKTDSESSSSAEDGDSGTRSSFDDENHQEMDDASESQNGEESQQDEELFINIPEPVKRVLEEDYFHIKHYKKLLTLPCEPNVITLLEGFVRNFACNLVCKTPEKPRAHRSSTCSNNSQSGTELGSLSSTNSLAICKEVVDGLRVSFDFLLPLTLLYDPERPQYEKLKDSADCQSSKEDPQGSSSAIVVDNALFHEAVQWRVLPDHADKQFLPSKVYGLVHLLRLLVRLPDVIHKMYLNHDKKLSVIYYAELLLQYLSRQTNLVSEANYLADH